MMLVYDGEPRISITLTLLADAIAHQAAVIDLKRRALKIEVAYTIRESIQLRDEIPNRHWHDLVAVLHLLLSASIWQATESSDYSWDTASDSSNTFCVSAAQPLVTARWNSVTGCDSWDRLSAMPEAEGVYRVYFQNNLVRITTPIGSLLSSEREVAEKIKESEE